MEICAKVCKSILRRPEEPEGPLPDFMPRV